MKTIMGRHFILMEEDKGGAGGGGGAGGNDPGAAAAWQDSLPADLKEEASLKLIKDVPNLARSYVNAQKMIGADKIAVPGKHATDEDWNGVYQKLGLPKEVKDYDVKFKEGMTIDKEFSEAFKGTAHKLGILPKQAQALADWFAEANGQAETKLATEFKTAQDNRINDLKKEWGQAYDQKTANARQVVEDLQSPELIKYLNDTGLTGEPNLVKVFAALHDKFYAESKEKGGQNGNGGNSKVLTPKEAQSEINKIMGDMNGPYFQKDHPGHKQAVEDVRELHKLLR